LISLLLFVFTIEAWACKPAPLPGCDKPEILLREAAFQKLDEQSVAFQQALTAGILESDSKIRAEKSFKGNPSRTSCFNNNFAVFYLKQIKDYAQKHGKMICANHLDFIDGQIKQLIDASTLERKAVTVISHQDKLKKLSVAVTHALDVFQGEHSK
jgi:hypothetical protein